jgi:dCMP deaminase
MPPKKAIEDWNEYFLLIADAVSLKSKDPKCQVGAVIASRDRLVVSTGYNGLPRGVFDDKTVLSDAEEKLKVICHAELNAILNAARLGASLTGASIYVNKFPCLSCLNSIIQAGIETISTNDHWYWDDDPFDQKDGPREAHSRKREVIRQSRVTILAPFHPDFRKDKKAIYQILMDGDVPTVSATLAQASSDASEGSTLNGRPHVS